MTDTQAEERASTFARRLIEYRAGLDEDDRESLDALLQAAHHALNEVDGYATPNWDPQRARRILAAMRARGVSVGAPPAARG